MGVVIINQPPTPGRIAVYPILKGGLDLLLLVLGQTGFLNIRNSLLLPVYILDIIYNLDRLQIQTATQNLIKVLSLCTEGGGGLQAVAVYGTPFDVPGGVEPVIADFYRLRHPAIRLHRFQNELLDILWRNPGSSKVQFNFRCGQVFRLNASQRIHVDLVTGVLLGEYFSRGQLFAYITREVFFAGLIQWLTGSCRFTRNAEYNAGQFLQQLTTGFAGELLHIGQIHTGMFLDRQHESLIGGIYMVNHQVWPDGSFGKHIRLRLKVVIIVVDFQRAKQVVSAILTHGQRVCTTAESAILLRIGVILEI